MAARTPQEPAGKPVPEAANAAENELLGEGTLAEESRDELLERIRLLEAEKEALTAAKDIAEEESARLSAQAQSALLTSGVVERFAGKAEDGETDLWFYRIDLAPAGGDHLKINGKPYLHGHTYKFDTDTLRCIKEMVARTWVHENDINGHAFNPYKQHQNKVLGGGAAPAWAYQ
ncbi:hypothetical protein C7399_109188 [Paraburkholderia tropica]|uniref:Uncharacterized protein n=1 Tax=Paraburkholderia tropica TaxID=92647 RepID=A0ABX5MU75_9BURK|nr:hypothetical protein [Paraburkholderia tropica]PXX15853.1 hypothetical protein C7400_109188 [Paraburkholderia tropica]PZW82112.1 hypothetical protein C7399_109188 [Paraburkholderia tropica]